MSSDATQASFDSTRWSRSVSKIKPRYSFSAATPADARRWAKTLRRRFVQRLGGFPEVAAPLRPQSIAREQFPYYSRETISFTSRDGLRVFAYLLLPHEAARALPALLCLHGHGPGVDPIVGIHSNGDNSESEYQHEFAVQAVQRGYAVLAPEILGFGRRRAGAVESPDASTCQTLAGTALMLGQTMAGWRVYDAIRCCDYLQTRCEVDATRLGAMGISGGGLNALFLAAVDERIQATMCSGFLNTFRDSLMAIDHCIDNFVPGLLQDAEMKDIAGLIAPRALWCENGTSDPIFPLTTFRSALRETRHIYSVLGAAKRCGGEVFEGGHFFHGVGAWKFLARNL